MKVCYNCDSLIDESCTTCPHCGHFVGQTENL
jgi:RNA polymerase subunit RPABC4/transcription elongation factor Spt4